MKQMAKYLESIDDKADDLYKNLLKDEYFSTRRICPSCGADKGLEAILHAGDGILALSNVKRLLGCTFSKDMEDDEAIAVLFYALGRHLPTPCHENCFLEGDWAKI